MTLPRGLVVRVSDFGTRELGWVSIIHCFFLFFFKRYNAEILHSSSMAFYK